MTGARLFVIVATVLAFCVVGLVIYSLFNYLRTPATGAVGQAIDTRPPVTLIPAA